MTKDKIERGPCCGTCPYFDHSAGLAGDCEFFPTPILKLWFDRCGQHPLFDKTPCIFNEETGEQEPLEGRMEE